MRVRTEVAAGLALLALAAEASAQDSSAGFQIRLSVPEVCRVQATEAVVGDGAETVTARVFEMCNSRRPFRVVASHRPLEAGERVRISYAGQVSELDASGFSEVASRSGPVARDAPVIIESDGLRDPIVISFGTLGI